MNFRQIISQFTPVDCKNKLNDLLASVERNFGVFSPDMELDIRSIISKDEVIEYFDRIIHENNPVLEYDTVKKDIKSSPKSLKKESYAPKQDLTPKQKLKLKRKEEKKKAKREKAIQQDKAIRNAEKQKKQSEQQYGKYKVPDFALRKLVKNGRDYSKPSLATQVNCSRADEGKEKPRQWVRIISVPMGGQNKKY